MHHYFLDNNAKPPVWFIQKRFALDDTGLPYDRETGSYGSISHSDRGRPRRRKLNFTYNGRQYGFTATTITWVLVVGAWPPVGYKVDHIDDDRFNDRIGNLRLLAHRDNTSRGQCKKANRPWSPKDHVLTVDRPTLAHHTTTGTPSASRAVYGTEGKPLIGPPSRVLP